MSLYYKQFEHRRPPEPVPFSPRRELLFQTLAVAAVVVGVWYLVWRWTASLNRAALWFAIPLVVAETLAFIGSILFFLSTWRTRDTPQKPPPRSVNEIVASPLAEDRPLIVDVFFATYNEEEDLLRDSVRDAKAIRYPHPIELRVHLLDDGKRPSVRTLAEEEGVGYITRTSNVGFKAGNLRNALEHTHGDLVVICDADTRPFPALLEETLGYFRDPEVAWVQTPQWFYDLDEGVRLPEFLARRAHLGGLGRLLGRGVEAVIGPLDVGADPLGNDPQMFYDVILRRRNWCNAAFCCGAGSIHRREAVMEAALKSYAREVHDTAERVAREVPDPDLRADLHTALVAETAREAEFTPYKFHVSEDIYTSIVLHSDPERQWKSVFHPRVLSRMLSPQDLLAWTIQRFKYAGGTLDIFRNDNPLRLRALSPWQKVCYGATIYSYFAPVWTVPFLLAPVIYLFTGIAPVAAYDADFYGHVLPFLVLNKLAFLVGSWGVSTHRGEQYYLGFFWTNVKALWAVLRGQTIKFKVTPKTKEARRQAGLVWPHLALFALTLGGVLFRGVLIALGHPANVGAYAANTLWSAYNLSSLSPIVRAALRRGGE